MKNLKFLIVLTLLLTGTVATQAQEKQNDATWEETIEFLKNNTNVLNWTEPYSRDRKHKHSVNITNEKLIFKTIRVFSDGSGGKITKTLMLKDLIKAGYSGAKSRYIRLTANGDLITVSDYQSYNSGTLALPLPKNIDDMAGRILKAFKHLAYLANEKRKESKF